MWLQTGGISNSSATGNLQMSNAGGREVLKSVYIHFWHSFWSASLSVMAVTTTGQLGWVTLKTLMLWVASKFQALCSNHCRDTLISTYQHGNYRTEQCSFRLVWRFPGQSQSCLWTLRCLHNSCCWRYLKQLSPFLFLQSLWLISCCKYHSHRLHQILPCNSCTLSCLSNVHIAVFFSLFAGFGVFVVLRLFFGPW